MKSGIIQPNEFGKDNKQTWIAYKQQIQYPIKNDKAVEACQQLKYK